MQPAPFTRETFPAVPAGKVCIAYPSEAALELMVESTVIATAVGALPGFPTVTLASKSRGWACAGSMMRWDEARWSVTYLVGAAEFGKSFLATAQGEAEARAYFAKITDYEAVSAKRQEAAMLEETVYAPARAARAAEAATRAQAEKERKAARRRALREMRKGAR